jgi:lysophospholipase L1-like esterase
MSQPLPARGATDWYAWAQEIHGRAAGMTGEEIAADPAVRAAFAPLAASAATAANTQRLLSKLRRGVEDAAYLYLGDSTGNETIEHVYLEAQALGQRFPAYTVLYHLIDPDTGAYGSPVTVQTGTGPQTLRVYNASVSGSQPAWVLGSRWTGAVTAAGQADVVFVSHGHNMNYGAAWSENFRQQFWNNLLLLTEEVAWRLPRAGIVLMSQNPTTVAGRETWQALKAGEIQMLAARRGYGFIDVHEAFQATGNPAAHLTGDGVHPTTSADAPAPDGSRLWADTILAALDYTPLATPGVSRDPLFLTTARQLAPNREFADWTGTAPTW